MPDNLKPCPFCGGRAVSLVPSYGRPYVACESNFCTGPRDIAEEAEAAWNRRDPTIEALQARVAELGAENARLRTVQVGDKALPIVRNGEVS
jgi:hypothetical protein